MWFQTGYGSSHCDLYTESRSARVCRQPLFIVFGHLDLLPPSAYARISYAAGELSVMARSIVNLYFSRSRLRMQGKARSSLCCRFNLHVYLFISRNQTIFINSAYIALHIIQVQFNYCMPCLSILLIVLCIYFLFYLLR